MYSASLLYMLLVWLMLPIQSEQACDAECVTCTDNTCTTCEDGFYVDGNYTLCTQCQNNGCTCSDTNTCTGCIPGYYYADGTGTCNKCFYSGCTCNDEYGCNSCVAGYYVYFSYCSSCTSGCSCSYSWNRCADCRDGYYLQNNNNYCSKCDSKCKLCEDYSASCSKCQDGYYLTNNQCMSCSSGCTVCTSQDTCSACPDGYYMFNNQCYRCSNGCSRCISDTSCSACTAGYHLSESTCQQCPTGCSSCNSQTSCSGCNPGYHLSGVTCQQCPTGCSSCNSQTYCSGCTTGYQLKQNICCPSLCTSCTSGTSCTTCIQGRYGVQCQSQCPYICKNDVCGITHGECTAGCKDSYQGRDGCPCPDNCKDNVCDVNGCTSGCDVGYYGANCNTPCLTGCIDNVCDRSSGECTSGCHYGTAVCPCPVNCNDAVCNSGSGTCSQGCRDGYYGNKCTEICRDNCLKCTDLFQCQTCKPGWHGQSCDQKCPDKCTACESLDDCSSCVQGFYLTSGTCTKCSDNCKVCTAVSCDRCVQGYRVQWQDGTNVCVPCPSNCLECTSSTYCGKCAEGYIWSYYPNYVCDPCPSNCLECSSSTSCGKCTEGYSRRNNNSNYVCDPCPSNCSVCSSSTSCNTCMTGYYRYYPGSGYLCAQCQEECTDCTNDGCNQCKEGSYRVYINYANQCDNCSESCKSCSSDTNCNTCQDGYYKLSTNGPCQQCMDNCKTCGAANTCTDCYPGYTYTEGTCQQDCPVNCKNNMCSVDKEKCTDGCKDRYFGLICDQNCSTNCISCDQDSGRCSICETGLYGDYCSETCSSGCKTTNGTDVCNIADGACTDGCQLSIKYGPQCSKDCSVHCVNQECDRVTARCLKGCQPGYHGESCTFACSEGCINGSCHGSNGSCISGCKESFIGEQCTAALSHGQSVDGGAIGGAVGGVVAGVLIIAGVVVGVCLLRRRREADKPLARNGGVAFNNTGNPIYENHAEVVDLALQGSSNVWNPEYDRLSSEVTEDAIAITITDPSKAELLQPEDDEEGVLIGASVDVTGEGYYNVGTLSRSVPLEGLAAFVSGKPALKYKEEFKLLPQGLFKPHTESKKPANVSLNRYRGIYPYDETRVILRDGGPDYINASYVNGYEAPKAYIAALGPTKNTIPNIWRMIWQDKVGKIVMLTNLVELGATKCEQYWPDNGESRDYAGIDVTTKAEEVYAEFTVRQFTLQKAGTNRTVTHIHYTAWPDKGVPDDVTSLVEFLQKVDATSSTQEGPTLVHCSAGIGRTGTYVALDILTKEGEAEGSVNIMGCVVRLREQRVSMVQTDEQYTYLHHAVVHSLTFHCKHVTGSKFQQQFHDLCETETNGVSELQSRFKLLQKTLEQKKADRESIAKNKTFTNKNRAIDAVPADRHRPRLQLSLKPGSSDYINAVFFNSYKRKDGLVLTQTPLPDTVVDFWRLVVQERTPCVVSMDDPLVVNKTAVKYWPNKSDKVTFGIFTIKKTKSVTDEHYVINTLNVEYHEKSGVKTHKLTQFVFNGWSNIEMVPPSPASLVQLIDQVERMKSQYAESDGPIIAHCLSGSERSGLFFAVSILLEKMKTEQEVSVVNTVRSLKSRRPQVIPSLEQYKFCYEAVVTYLESFNTYSNFQLR